MKTLSKITVLISILFLIKLTYLGDLNFLIHPRYFILVYLSIGFLLLTLLFNRQCEHDKQKIYLVFPLLLIFTFGLMIDFKPLSSSNQKSVQYQSVVDTNKSNREKYRTVFDLKTDELSLSELISVFSVDPEPSKYVGKPVRVTGFYFETSDGSPMIARYSISCCAADAQLIGIWLDKPLTVEPDTWLEIEGKLDSIESSFGNFIDVKVSKFKIIETPKNPYVT